MMWIPLGLGALILWALIDKDADKWPEGQAPFAVFPQTFSGVPSHTSKVASTDGGRTYMLSTWEANPAGEIYAVAQLITQSGNMAGGSWISFVDAGTRRTYFRGFAVDNRELTTMRNDFSA